MQCHERPTAISSGPTTAYYCPNARVTRMPRVHIVYKYTLFWMKIHPHDNVNSNENCSDNWMNFNPETRH